MYNNLACIWSNSMLITIFHGNWRSVQRRQQKAGWNETQNHRGSISQTEICGAKDGSGEEKKSKASWRNMPGNCKSNPKLLQGLFEACCFCLLKCQITRTFDSFTFDGPSISGGAGFITADKLSNLPSAPRRFERDPEFSIPVYGMPTRVSDTHLVPIANQPISLLWTS